MNAELTHRTLDLPRVLWIELTSRCPFDCVYCTRKSLRGAGQHMDFACYQRLLRELDRPQLLRLNYAGESGHYPQICEAIRLAAATGAEVELVTALASLKPERVQAILEAGLSRLTISLHSLDDARFRAIYRYGSVQTMRARLEQVVRWCRQASRPIAIDLAFVAMWRNLAELPDIAAYAQGIGVGVLAVHPLIARDPLPLGEADEHRADGTLNARFAQALRSALECARQRAPAVSLLVSSHELAPPEELDEYALPWPWPLPDGARIAGCDQSPFETVHILADGRVVACEVTEKCALGSLLHNPLREIWQGDPYRDFRQAHLHGTHPSCRLCVYKRAYRPGPLSSRVDGDSVAPGHLLNGWYSGDDGCGVVWSASRAALLLARPPDARQLRLAGILAEQTAASGLVIRVDGMIVYQQAPARPGPISLDLPLPQQEGILESVVEIACTGATSPKRLGHGEDARELGFALMRAALI